MDKWNKLYSEGAKYRPINEEFLNKLLLEINKKTGESPKTLIDLGCGPGDSLISFIKKGFSVVGIDFSKVALEKAKQNLDKLGLKAELIQMDLENLNIYKKADVIFCKLVLAFIKNKSKFLKIVKKMMNENSSFVLITPVLYKNIEYTKKDKPGIAIYFKELDELLNNVFTSINIINKESFGDNGEILTFLLK
ncbi:MAG: class I SAM-dependent methyltransferase [Candidatus Magasanikbacteria bacterium]|nr:class I SAM-dependent methyltransferase [Candidatus Magasanikbacteria bacterium]